MGNCAGRANGEGGSGVSRGSREYFLSHAEFAESAEWHIAMLVLAVRMRRGGHTEKTEKQNILFTRIAQIAQRVSQWM